MQHCVEKRLSDRPCLKRSPLGGVAERKGKAQVALQFVEKFRCPKWEKQVDLVILH